MMRSTKITIALALGLAGAAGLGFMMMSEPAEAGVPLKIYADVSFAANPDENIPVKTLQLKSGSNFVDSLSNYPVEKEYIRSGDGSGYNLSIKGGADCIFVSGDYEGSDIIPKDVTEVYLTFDKNTNFCHMDTKQPANLEEFKFNIYAKNINNSGVKLKTVNAANEEKIINDNVTNSADVPVIKPYQFEAETTEKLVVDFYGSAVDCKLGEKEEITSKLKSLNVVIDGTAKTCKLAPPVVKINLNVTNVAYGEQKFYIVLVDNGEAAKLCPDYIKTFKFDKDDQYEIDAQRIQTVDCAVLPMYVELWFYQEHVFCNTIPGTDKTEYFPIAATVANVTAHYGSSSSETTCTINGFE